MKLFVLAIDGLDPRHIREGFEDIGGLDAIPNLSSLHGQGTTDSEAGIPAEELERGKYPNSWGLWTDFATGVTHEKHGVKYARFSNGVQGGTADFDASSRFWQSSDLPESVTPLYHTINQGGYSVGWSRLPVSSYPTSPLDGWMLSGSSGYPPSAWPDTVKFQPKHVPEWNEDKLWDLVSFEGDHNSFVPDSAFIAKHEQACKQFVQVASYIEENYFEAMVDVVRQKPVDCVFHYIRHSDGVGHALSNHKGLTGMFYRNIDQWFGSFVEEFEPEKIVILSDHGMESFNENTNPDDWDEDHRIVEWGGKYRRVVSGRKGFFVMEGGHSQLGTYLVNENALYRAPRSKVGLGSIAMIDLYPSICRLLGVPYDEDFVMGEEDKTLSQGEDNFKDNLKALGYLS